LLLSHTIARYDFATSYPTVSKLSVLPRDGSRAPPLSQVEDDPVQISGWDDTRVEHDLAIQGRAVDGFCADDGAVWEDDALVNDAPAQRRF
jgi:hypothetical protein